MSETFVLDTVARFVGGTEDAELRISNAGTGTIYYDNEKTVSSSSNDGSIAAGASATRRLPTWIVATTQTPITITRVEHTQDTHNVHGYIGDFANLSVYEGLGISPEYVDYGAVGDGVFNDTAAVQAAAADLEEGDTFFLPNTYAITAPVTISVDRVTVTGGGKLLATTSQTLVITGDDVTVDGITCERAVTGSGTTPELCNVAVAGARARILNCNFINAKLACLYFANAAANGSVVRGGTMTNTSLYSGSSLIAAASSGGAAVNEDILIDGVSMSGACTVGVGFFDSCRCSVVNCSVSGMAELATVTLTGWANVSGNVYRATDRTDGVTRTLLDNGTQRTENIVTPTAPGSNEWGISGGFVYLNLGGTNPSTRTITSKIVSGYGVMFYVTGEAATPAHDNLVAHNTIHDTDGFGIYFAFGSASIAANNRSIGNTLRNVCTSGSQNSSLPFAGIGVDGGRDSLFLGDTIQGTYRGLYVINAATGRASNVTVKDATDVGFQINTSQWTCQGCKALDPTSYGFRVFTAASETFKGLAFIDCIADGSDEHGMWIDNTTGTALSVQVRGGYYRNNTHRGVILTKCSDSSIIGVTAHDNGAVDEQVYVNHTSSARIHVDQCVVYGTGLTYGIVFDAGTDLTAGTNHVSGATSPLVTALPSVASATATTLGAGSVFSITGTTTITSVTASWAGRVVTLKFADVLTFTDGSNLKLAGSMTTSADDTITLVSDGTSWYEQARSAN